jgi:RNA 3'-terminal phosphate cyclase (ATP)
MIEINGDYLEGGGSIARVALALSTIRQKAFAIDNIRANRPQPGLKNQHLFCVKALEQLCNASAEGVSLGSTSLKYVPGKINAKNIEIDIQTAGSISLFLQSILLPAMFSNKTLTLKVIGGTDTKWAAPIDYYKEVFLPQLRKYADIDLKLLKRGYFPKGQGIVELDINPIFKLSDFNHFEEFLKDLRENTDKINLTEQGHLIQIKGISHASADLQDSNVAERQAETAAAKLKRKYSVPVNVSIEYQNSASIGSGIVLWAIFSKDENEIDEKNPIRLGADALGEKSKKAEEVGKEAAENLIKEIDSKAAADSHLADQILPFMSLIGNSKIKTSKITNHTKTNIYTIEKFFGKCFEVDEKENVISTIN